MPNFNQVIIIGHITRNIDVRYLPSGSAAADFGIAVNKNWKDKDGSKRQEVCFVDCVAFAATAENINKFFKKGDAIMIVGSLKFEQWEDKNGGGKRSKHKIAVDRFEFVGGRNESTGNAAASPAPQDDTLPAVPEVPF